ncbi:hypothetical protein ACWD3J_28305 [Streptomyces sp. NPDC002755]|uniref:hypothetical protein n=1 Tax=Streptomyces sp. NPDC002884 TaxID=3154544 RepID=UPI003319EF4B
MTSRQWGRFRKCIREALARHHSPQEFDEAAGIAWLVVDENVARALGPARVDLRPLAELARNKPEFSWPKLFADELLVAGLTDFCDRREAEAEQIRQKLLGEGTAGLRRRLAPRVGRRTATAKKDQMVERHLGAGLVAQLAMVVRDEEGRAELDWPRIKVADLARLSVDTTELWAMGLHNLRGCRYRMRGEQPITVLTGGTDVSAQLLRLPEVAEDPLRFGAVVMIPLPNVLCFHVVRDADAVVVMETMRERIPAMLRQSGATSDSLDETLYWWHDDRAEEITLDVSPGAGGPTELTLASSQPFSAMLTRMLDGFEPPEDC